MFNHSVGRPRASESDEDPTFGYHSNNQPWPRFGVNSSSTNSAGLSQAPHASERSFSSSTGMDWTPTHEMQHMQQFSHDHGQPSNNVEFDEMAMSQGGGGNGGGVGRLVAHFENKGFAPPLPRRPSHAVMSPAAVSPSVSSPFGNFDVASPIVASPLASPPVEPAYSSLSGPSPRANHHLAAPSPMTFGGMHHEVHQTLSPVMGSSTDAFGSMDSFMANNRMAVQMSASPMMPSPMVTAPKVESPHPGTPAVPGTPGFAIWRPPVAGGPKPNLMQTQISSPQMANEGYFAKPPVPTTPKPVMNAGSQLVLDFNSDVKGKAPARPPLPKRHPVRRPSVQQMSAATPPLSSPLPNQAPPTPQMSQASSSSHAERRGSMSLRPQTGTRPSREQVPAEAWESFKTTIRGLYLEERKPLKEVMSIMADKYGFQATPKMYKTRFSQWGFVKNNTEEEVKRLLSMKFQRDAEGKVSEFVRNGKVVNLGTYLKRKGVTEYDLVDFELPADLPAHIRCRTPTPPPAPGYLQSPDLVRAQETVLGNMRKAFLQCRQFEVETDAQIPWACTMTWGAGSSDLLLEANHYFEMRDVDQGGHFLMRAFKQLESDLKKLSPQGIQELLLGMVRRDPGMMTALCKYLAAYSTTNFERSHPLRQIFSCLYEVQQKHGSTTLSDLLWECFPTITEELEAIYSRRHPYVARAWTDLAIFYNHANPEKLEKVIAELWSLQRQMEHRLGADNVEVYVLRYCIVQLMYAANPQADNTKQAAVNLWNHARSMKLVFPVRDSRPNVFCYHSPVKVDPWTKRCRRRYEWGTTFMQENVGVRIMPYFEEDFHTTEHAPEPQDAWAAVMQQQISSSKWGFL